MTQTIDRPGASATAVNKGPNRNAPWPAQFYATAVGKKWVMALTGLGMTGFVVAHMIGNLKLYLGQEDGRYALDVYAEALRKLLYPIAPEGAVLWLLRIGLIAMLLLHLHAALTLTQMNHAARPSGYKAPRDYVAVNFASRTMRITGIIVLAYLIFHLFDLTLTGTGQGFVHGEVHNNLVASLQRPWAAIAYIVANVALMLHLFHGLWSMFQSMGLNNPRWNAARRLISVSVAVVVGGANVLFPVLILARVVK